MNRKMLLSLTLISVTFGGTQYAKADLSGSTVTIGGYCCTSPTAPDLFTNVLTGTVPVSFPVGSLHSVTTLAIIPSSFDITANQITQTSSVAARAASGSFNGVVYDFSGLSSPITNVTLDALSTSTPVSVTFTGTSVAVNGAGLSISAGSKYILDVSTDGDHRLQTEYHRLQTEYHRLHCLSPHHWQH